MKFLLTFLMMLGLSAQAQQSVTILNRFNQHNYEDRVVGSRDGYLDIWAGTNFFNRYEHAVAEDIGVWPLSLSTTYVTNYYIWSYIAPNGQFVVTTSVQWINIPGSIEIKLINQPLPSGVVPRFPFPHLGTNNVYTVYTSLENKGSTQLKVTRYPDPSLNPNKAWYYRLNCYVNGYEWHTGVILGATGSTRTLTINQTDLIDGSNHGFMPPPIGFFDGPYDGGHVEYDPLNPSHVNALGTSYSAPAIPPLHYILENYIPNFFGTWPR